MIDMNENTSNKVKINSNVDRKKHLIDSANLLSLALFCQTNQPSISNHRI